MSEQKEKHPGSHTASGVMLSVRLSCRMMIELKKRSAQMGERYGISRRKAVSAYVRAALIDYFRGPGLLREQ